MYTKPVSVAPVIFQRYGRVLLLYVSYVVAVWVAYDPLGFKEIDIKMASATILGFTISLLLGFRTAASYDRWWEARKVWGGIVNDSRTLVRQAIGFAGKGKPNQEIKELAYYMIAWCYALKNGLRKLDPLSEIGKYMSATEKDELSKKNNKHNEILKLMELKLSQMREKDMIDGFQHVALDNTLKQLCDHMGKCERIKNTVFPERYRGYTHKGILIFLVMLPYGMLFSTGPFSILICSIVAFFFLMIESIAYSLQDPFSNIGSDTPMTALSRAIEVNILELLEEDHDLEMMVPDKIGVLM